MKKIPLKGLNEIVYYDECENGLPILLWPHEKAQGYYLTLSAKMKKILSWKKIKWI